MTDIDEQNKLLYWLSNHKEGLNSHFAQYGLSVKNPGIRIKELQERGLYIKAFINNDRSIQWLLLPKPSRKKIKVREVKHIIYSNDGVSVKVLNEEEYKEYCKPAQQSFL